MMKNLLFLFICIFILTGCGIKQNFRVADGIDDAKQISIIDNPSTRKSFKIVMITWLKDHNYEVKLLPEGSNPSESGWALTYHGKWSWDLAIYLSDAEIKAYQNGNHIAESSFHVNGGSMSIDPNKYGSAETRVNEMMSNLFTKK